MLHVKSTSFWWRCTQYFGDALWQIQFKTYLDRYFVDASQQLHKKEIFKFPTETSRFSNHNQNRDSACLWAEGPATLPKPSSLPSSKDEWGKEINHCKRAAGVWRKKGQRTWDYFCSKTNWLDKWNIMESADSAPLSICLSSGHFICPSSSQQSEMKCKFYCKLLYSAGCKRLEDSPKGNELASDWFIL